MGMAQHTTRGVDLPLLLIAADVLEHVVRGCKEGEVRGNALVADKRIREY